MLGKYSKDFLREHLIPRQIWRPFPQAADRGIWREATGPAQRRAVKREIIRQAEKLLGQPWPQLPATLFMEFIRNGNRSNYETPYFQRRQHLAVLALAECFEYRGRFLDEIINGLWHIMEETT
jgi:hypothetical protein